MSKKLPMIPGFKAVNDVILVSEPSDQPIPAIHPETILIYGWGDGIPKHVAKYAEGYRVLFPHSRQIVILGPIWKSLFAPLAERTSGMVPVVDALEEIHGKDYHKAAVKPRILVHTMSNTGASNYAVTLNAFRIRNEAPLPHALFTLDSTPGSPYMTRKTLHKWARAMTLGTAAWFPWPFFVTQIMWTIVLVATRIWGWFTGNDFAGVYALKTTDSHDYETKDAKRIYLYSEADEIISSEDIEKFSAIAREKGYHVRGEIFEGTGHVGHMRQHSEQYWSAIASAWAWAIGQEK
ncbi:hypothetical protein F5X68DRAFT_159326 [Plectosphaerella plurivora]|uniref:Uncharacterized protein n=1 Tax=Plectosphaerella plurivora TaxID=936078 RepID=A0A9P8V3D2_9PEZI|nr:hypothetical protein F5X68DRAFT_159326 [Plectosphaerella plurivora]